MSDLSCLSLTERAMEGKGKVVVEEPRY
jgi:hypothetical protein